MPADFTVEFWVYLNSTSDQSFVGKWSRPSGVDQFAWIVQLNSSNLRFYSGNSGGIGTGNTFSWSPVTGTWYYIAITRSGSSLRAFINGVQAGSTVTESNNLTSTSSTSIGINLDGNIQPTNGYISSVRVVKGTALYTTTFTPPTAPLTAITNTQLLTNFTNGAIFDNAMMNDLETVGNAQISTSVVKYGTGSLAFDGTGDYLTGKTVPIGSGDFTFECWVYLNVTGVDQHFVQIDIASNTNAFLSLDGAPNKFRFVIRNDAGTSNSDIGSSISPSANTWYHIAGVVSGGSSYLFVNGSTTLGATGALSGTRSGTGTDVYIGHNGSGGLRPLNGYLDDVRITKGYARYTANFTPPTTALGAISAP